MSENLRINIIEHEVLAPRTAEEWGHSPFYCYVCNYSAFKEARQGYILADMINWGHEAWLKERQKLQDQSVIDPRNRS